MIAEVNARQAGAESHGGIFSFLATWPGSNMMAN